MTNINTVQKKHKITKIQATAITTTTELEQQQMAQAHQSKGSNSFLIKNYTFRQETKISRSIGQ